MTDRRRFADVSLQVNGEQRNLRLDTRTSLLDALREHLGLTGSKKGCDHGQCGACTVQLDGRRTLSRLALAVAAEGSEVTSVEGLAGPDGGLHPVQQAFLDADAHQCGYCTPGQVCSAVGVLAEVDAGWPSAVTGGEPPGLTDIGTGARTALGQVAADAPGVPYDRVEVCVGDSTLPPANVAGGSMGTASWAWAVDKAGRQLRELAAGGIPEGGPEVRVETKEDLKARDRKWARHAFGAHFAEVRVDADTGEVRVSRLEAHWIPEEDPHVNPLGIKGTGEIGIVGTPAAIGNAVWHATGIRVRDLPIRLDKLL